MLSLVRTLKLSGEISPEEERGYCSFGDFFLQSMTNPNARSLFSPQSLTFANKKNGHTFSYFFRYA
jgi:hypothetical protein